MTVKCNFTHDRIKEIYLDGVWYRTNEPVELELSKALRYRRSFAMDISPVYSKEAYDPKLFRRDKLFGFTGDADSTTGFGNCTVNLIQRSVDSGYDVRWVGRNNQVPALSRLEQKDLPPGMAMVWHEQPPESWKQSPFPKNIAILPFETTRIPPSWVPRVNSMDALLAISDQNVQMFRDSGVTIPISKIGWGVDEKKFGYIERPDDGTFTFGQCGALSTRKGTDILIKAFLKAFPPFAKHNVRLLLKTSYNVFTFGVKNERRIEVLMMPMDFDEYLNRFWKKVDCFVFPSRGEGWGLPAMEAMMTGLPTIVTDWGGFREFTTPDTAMLLKDYRMVRATEFDRLYQNENCGDWAEPSVDELADRMAYAYWHQDEMKELGKRAHVHIKTNFLWDDAVKGFHKALGEYL